MSCRCALCYPERIMLRRVMTSFLVSGLLLPSLSWASEITTEKKKVAIPESRLGIDRSITREDFADDGVLVDQEAATKMAALSEKRSPKEPLIALACWKHGMRKFGLSAGIIGGLVGYLVYRHAGGKNDIHERDGLLSFFGGSAAGFGVMTIAGAIMCEWGDPGQTHLIGPGGKVRY